MGDRRLLGQETEGRAPARDRVGHVGRFFGIKADQMGPETLGKPYGRFDPGLVPGVVGKMDEDRFEKHGRL